MATIDIWLQIENHPWDVCPSMPLDRMTSAGTLPTLPLVQVTLHSPVTGVSRTQIVNRPLAGDALILRRYTKDWKAPDDRKVNPWDLNEADPTDAGTMGTIPGPTIECDVGDNVLVHFRNADMRKTPAAPWDHTAASLPPTKRTHSLHAHGFTFPTKYDGAYPLSPPDSTQPITASERSFWDAIGVKGPYKQCDRVPPGASFTYVWQAQGPASAGVWIYHDHSICDMENTARGALGMIVIHNVADKLNEVDITPERLPGGSWVGSPLIRKSVKVKEGTIGIPLHALVDVIHETPGHHGGAGPPALRYGKAEIELTNDMSWVKMVSLGTYRAPPDQALYLLLFHELEGVGMCINGRQFLGNTPTLVAGVQTRMRFGVAGMGESFHTFHIHGHRWVIPGPSGKTPTAIEQSAQTEPTSPFEDTKMFGPGSSFAFTLEEGKGLFRADPPLGEWHMHCHVPSHMMHGMVGSLLVINGGELAMPLPEGQACPPDPVKQEPPPPPAPKPYQPVTHIVIVSEDRFHFNPKTVNIYAGDSVRWINQGTERHSATADKGGWFSGALAPGQSFAWKFSAPGDNWYHCDFHSADEPTYAFGRVWVDPAPGSSVAPVTPPAGGGATTHQVQINSTGFSPSTITIKVGDAVNWTNQDSVPHMAAGDDHAWSTPTLPLGKSFARTFSAPGTIPYHCHIHPEMTGTLIVT